MAVYQTVYTISTAIHSLVVGAFSSIGLVASYPSLRKGIVIFTGASTGIGRDGCIGLALEGFVVLAGVRKASDGQELLDEFESRKKSAKKNIGKLIPIILDVTKQQDFENAKETLRGVMEKENLPLVGVVCNAGVLGVAGPVECNPEDEMRYCFDVNLWGVTRCVQAFGPLIRENKGRFILTGSMGGIVSNPAISAYAGTKHALEALADSLRIEYRPFNVSVSLLEPGAILTPIWAKGTQAAMPNPDKEPDHFWTPMMIRVRDAAGDVNKAGIPPEISTTPAIIHAMTSRYPKTRYLVGMDAIVATTLRRWLPDRLWDAFLGRLIIKW